MLYSPKSKIAVLVISGLALVSLGCIIYITFPLYLQNAIRKRLILSKGSRSYKYWKDVPVPIFIQFYLFTVTNPDEVYDLKKPVLEEMGPYTFREERQKVNITWNANGTVSYRQIKRWHFQPDRTVGSLKDRVISLNVPMVAAATKVDETGEYMVYFAIQEIFDAYKCTWLVNKTVEELLFKGYDDDLMKFAQRFMKLPYGKFGWFYARNNTDDGEFVVGTGERDIESIDEVHTWNGVKSTSAYAPPCNMINGSAGDIWTPGLTTKDKPTIFVTDICRSLSLTFLKEVKHNGVNALRFWSDKTELDNGKFNPNNKCFCNDDGICLPAGGVNVSSCKLDSPAVVSYPHFLHADSAYSDGVVGMRPNPEQHMMYFDIIPEMGVPLEVTARMQINVVFDVIHNIKQFQNITRRTYFPMLWFSESAEAGTDVTDQMKQALVTQPLIANISSFIFMAIGSFFVIAAFAMAILYALGKQKEPSDFPADTGS